MTPLSVSRHVLFLLLFFPPLIRSFIINFSPDAVFTSVSASNMESNNVESSRMLATETPNKFLPSQEKTIIQSDEILEMPSSITRRLVAAGLLSTFFVAGIRPAAAFDNGIPDMEKYRTKTKYPGTQPELGLQKNGKLNKCADAPNCFSSGGDESHLLKPWKPKAGSNAMEDLLETIQSYPPGQAKIDRGGFSIITSKSNYLYVQFESMKRGFIDDVEFAVTNKGEVQVRSSSRIGFLDLGVNAKRLNWISNELRSKGWTAPAITEDNYPDYFIKLMFTYDDYIRSVLNPDDCPVPTDPLTCKDPAPSS